MMLVIVSYDVSTTSAAGRKRLRRIAKQCTNFGQRVQFSVFECHVDAAQWAMLKLRLLDLYNPEQDSLRFYYLGSNWKGELEHYGQKRSRDPDEALFA